MVRERDRRKIVWPSYFDVRLSRANGRRVPKGICVEKPDIAMLSEALQSMNLDFELQKDKSFPARWWRREGRALVDTDIPKMELLMAIGKELKKTTQ